MTYKLTERRKETFSAILRKFDELFRPAKIATLSAPRMPMLFSVFLDRSKIEIGKTLVFGVELSVSTTEYEVDGFLFFDRTIQGEYLFRNTLVIRATPDEEGWKVRYNLLDDAWGESRGKEAQFDGNGFIIPLKSAKGFEANLRLNVEKLR